MSSFGSVVPLALLVLGTRPRGQRRGSRTMKTVRLPRHGEVTITVSLPLKGETCLRTNLLTKRVLSETSAGDIVEIESDNLSAVETIPFMAPNHDCEHLVTVQDGGCWTIYLRRRGDANSPIPAGARQTWPLKIRKGEEE